MAGLFNLPTSIFAPNQQVTVLSLLLVADRQPPPPAVRTDIIAKLKAQHDSGTLEATTETVRSRAAELAQMAGHAWEPSSTWTDTKIEDRDLKQLTKRPYGWVGDVACRLEGGLFRSLTLS